jgi:lysophospholipase L1-like esterase
MALLSVICLGLPVPLARAAEASSKEALPASIFRNLQATKKQTVVVYGTSLSHTAEWPKALKAYFDKHYPGQVTFINSAQGGQQSNWGVAALREQVLSRNPDLVFIEFSVNDAATKHGISTQKSRSNLDLMVKAMREQNPQVDIVIQTMNTAWDSPDEPSHKKYASDRPHIEQYYDVYRQYALEQGLPLVDHYQTWARLQKEDEAKFRKWLPDGLHPIPEASLAVTWSAVESLLEKARHEAAGH